MVCPEIGTHTADKVFRYTMSWSQRFMEKKSEGGPAADEWKTVGSRAGAGGGGGGGSWKPRAAGSWKPKTEAPKPVLNMDSEEQFPSLGSKPRPTADQARLQGFAALAASWASQDAAEAAEIKRQRDEEQKAAEQRAKDAAHYGVLESIMRRRNDNNMMSGGSGGYGSAAAYDDSGRYSHESDDIGAAGGRYSHASGANNERSYSPHSPTYPPYDEEQEPEPEEEEPRGNPMFAYDKDEEEGWTSR